MYVPGQPVGQIAMDFESPVGGIRNPGHRIKEALGEYGVGYGTPSGELDPQGYGDKLSAPSAFPDINSSHVVDVGVSPDAIPVDDRSYHRGKLMLVLKPPLEVIDDRQWRFPEDHPLGTEHVLFETVANDNELAGHTPVTIRALADTQIVYGTERDLHVAHADSNMTDVMPTPAEQVKDLLHQCGQERLWRVLEKTELYVKYGIVKGNTSPIAVPGDSLWVFPVIESVGGAIRIHWIPATNVTRNDINDIVTATIYPRGAKNTAECCGHGFYIGRLTQAYAPCELSWMVSIEAAIIP